VRAGVRELVEQASPQSVSIFRAKGRLIVSVDAVNRFEPIPASAPSTSSRILQQFL